MHKRAKLIHLYKENGFSASEAQAEVDFAYELIAGAKTSDLIKGIEIPDKLLSKINEAVVRRIKTKEPLAQIIGAAFFMGERFKVTKDTLIPRPETELLVLKTKELIEKNHAELVLDIGTGTGCIACMLAKLTKAQVIGVDISNDALRVSLDNAVNMNLMNRAIFRKSDLFSNVCEKFDLIVSNPPYIPKKEKLMLQFEVKEFEPVLALFTNDEYGVEYYERIISNASKYLKHDGHVIFELGVNQSKLVSDIFKDNGFGKIRIFQDLSGIDRVISAELL